jgi:hypothetical protein
MPTITAPFQSAIAPIIAAEKCGDCGRTLPATCTCTDFGKSLICSVACALALKTCPEVKA